MKTAYWEQCLLHTKLLNFEMHESHFKDHLNNFKVYTIIASTLEIF